MPDTSALLFAAVAVTNIAWLLRMLPFLGHLQHSHRHTYLDLVRPAWPRRMPWIPFRILVFIHTRRVSELNDIHLLRSARQLRLHLYFALAIDIAFIAMGSSFVERFSRTTSHMDCLPAATLVVASSRLLSSDPAQVSPEAA